ncbi:MAG: MFS transporter [Oligoflexia bacterium]|nr:MFS transporter [Oligoflexia bacterium]
MKQICPQINFIIVGYLSLLVLGLSDNLRGPLFPEILRDLNLSDTSGSLFFVVSALFSTVGSIFIRFIYDRFGATISLRPALIMIFLGLIGTGVSRSLSVLLVSSVVLGIGFGSLGFLENILVTKGAGSKNPYLRQLLSGLHSMYGLSSFLAPAIVTILHRHGFNWNHIFLLAAIAPLLLLFYTLTMKEVNVVSVNEKAQSKLPIPSVEAKGLQIHQILFALVVTFYVLGEVLISSRLALYIQRTTAGPLVSASSLLEYSSQMVMYFFIALFLGRLLFTFMPWKFSNLRLMQLSLGLSLISTIIGIMFSPYGFAISGFWMGPFFPTSIAYAVEIFKTKSDSAIWWALTLFSFGLVVMHFIVGVVSDHFGISVALSLAPAFLVLAIILLMIERWRYRNVNYCENHENHGNHGNQI